MKVLILTSIVNNATSYAPGDKLTLSDAELCTYIQQYTHYKVEAVHAALADGVLLDR